MIERFLVALPIFGLLFAAPAWSQSNDIAAERSRVANERIRIEAERMAQEEKQRAESAADTELLRVPEEEQVQLPAEVEQQDVVETQPDVITHTVAPSEAAPPETVPISDGETDRLGMSLMLEHLEVLGRLRDSGYVTEAEFKRIKQRILDGEL